jgi:hypothetical protein
MAQRCAGVTQPPAEVDLVATFTFGLIDLPTRTAVVTRNLQTLADAHRFALKA